MPNDTASIYRQYAEAYERCIKIEQDLRVLEAEHPNFEGADRARCELRRDGDEAYFELLGLYHRLNMCASLDIAAVRAKLQKCGVFVGEEEECSSAP